MMFNQLLHKMRSVPTRRARQRGSAAVETALVFPLMIATLLAFIYLVFVMHNYIVLTNAAREGARFGIVYASPASSRPTASQITTFTNQFGASFLIRLVAGPSTTVTISRAANPGAGGTPNWTGVSLNANACQLTGDLLKVDLAYGSGAPSLFGGTVFAIGLPDITLAASTTMRCE